MAIYRNRNFLLLWIGQSVSMTGTWILYLAILVLVREITGSATLTSIALILSRIPGVVLGPLAGGYVDRANRKWMMVGCDIISGCIVLSLIAVSWVYGGVAPIWYVYFVIALIAVVGTFFLPAIKATIPNVVHHDELTRANSLLEITLNITTVLGFGIGTTLILATGYLWAFFINGTTFLLSALSVSFIQLPSPTRLSERKKNILTDIREAFRFTLGMRTLLVIIITATLINVFIAPTPLFAQDLSLCFYGVGERGFGLLLISSGIGSLIATILLSIAPEVRKKYKIIIGSSSGIGLSILLLGTILHFYVGIVAFSVISFLVAFINIYWITFIQVLTPDKMRGKVFAISRALSTGAVPVAYGLTGIAIEWIGSPTVLITFGVVALIISLLLLNMKRMRML